MTDYQTERDEMIRTLRNYGISDERILDAMSRVRRHVFIPDKELGSLDPYGNYPCPIGYGQTISQPYIVAYMTERLCLQGGQKVLEIGSGCGYQSAVLTEMGVDVYSVEIIPELVAHAESVLAREGYDNVHVACRDGYSGWPENAPFDAILAGCAPKSVPPVLFDQLADGGRMILPVGTGSQRLILFSKNKGEIEKENDILVRFVPMVGGGK